MPEGERIAIAQTMSFTVLALSELVHVFNVRNNEKSIFKTGIFENKYLVGSFVLGIFIQTIVVIIPILANIFEVVPLNFTQWIITICISLIPIPVMEIQKALDNRNEHTVKNSNFLNDKTSQIERI